MRTKILLGILATLTLAGAAWASTTTPAKPNAPPAISKAASLVAPGLVEAERDVVSLAFDGSGRLVEVRVREGDHVAAGDLLAKLDDRLQRAAVAKASAALAAAEARAAAADHGARPDEIRAAAAEADAANAQAGERERQAARATELHEGGSIAAAQLDGERTAAETARAQADAASARLVLLRSGTRVEDRRAAAAAVEVARADLEEARARLAQTELRAPSAGTVVRRFVEPGEQVTTMPPTVILTVADLDHVRVRAEIDEADIARIEVGQRASLAAEALAGRSVTGHVVRIEHELGRKKIRTDDPRARLDTRVLEVIVDLDAPGALPLGLRSDVRFER